MQNFVTNQNYNYLDVLIKSRNVIRCLVNTTEILIIKGEKINDTIHFENVIVSSFY